MATCKLCETGNNIDDMKFEDKLTRIRKDDGVLLLETVVVHRCDSCQWLTHEIVDSERVL